MYILKGSLTSFFFLWQPAKTLGGYYCAVAVFVSAEEAEQAFENVNGYEETVLFLLRVYNVV